MIQILANKSVTNNLLPIKKNICMLNLNYETIVAIAIKNILKFQKDEINF